MKKIPGFWVMSLFVSGASLGYGGIRIGSWVYVWNVFSPSIPYQHTQYLGIFPLFSIKPAPDFSYYLQFHYGILLFAVGFGLLVLFFHHVHTTFSEIDTEIKRQKNHLPK